MKNTIGVLSVRVLGIIAIVAVIGFSALSLTGCDKPDDDPIPEQLPDLSGNITISPSTGVTTGTELSATYDGEETVTYQWKKDGSNVGTASTTKPNRYTPTDAGSYTVTVSADGFNSKTSAAVTVTVPTGPTWTTVPNTSIFGSTSYIDQIVYGNGKFVASSYDYKMATSSDGITWTAVTSPFDTSSINAIVYGNGKFVAGGGDGKIAYSSDDCVTWTNVDVTSIFETSGIRVHYVKDIFIARGSSGQYATSTDGITWKDDLPTSDIAIDDIAYGNDKFVAVGSAVFGDSTPGKRIMTSTDGETWTRVEVGSIFGTDATPISIAFGGGKFVAVKSANDKMATSTDGETWTAVTTNPTNLSKIIYGNDKFIALGVFYSSEFKTRIATSTDGTTWTAQDITAGLSNIAYGSGKIVAVGLSGKIMYLSDN